MELLEMEWSRMEGFGAGPSGKSCAKPWKKMTPGPLQIVEVC